MERSADLEVRLPGGRVAPGAWPRRTLALARRRPGQSAAPGRWIATALAVLGAALTVASGVIHLHLWATGYRHIAAVGPLFLVQGIVSFPLALALVVRPLVAVMLAGAAFLASTALGLLLSAWVALFGFRESLAAPYAAMSLVVELVGAVLLLVATGLVFVLPRRVAQQQ